VSRENVEVVRRALDAFARRDLEAILAEHRPDVEIVVLRSAIEGPYRGHEGLRRMGAELRSWAPDFELRIDEIRDCGERVVVLGHQRGTVRDAPFDHVFAAVYEVERGKVARMQAFTTAREALEAVGLSE
jgi:ketosteroid isomerase-like protein